MKSRKLEKAWYKLKLFFHFLKLRVKYKKPIFQKGTVQKFQKKDIIRESYINKLIYKSKQVLSKFTIQIKKELSKFDYYASFKEFFIATIHGIIFFIIFTGPTVLKCIFAVYILPKYIEWLFGLLRSVARAK